jgi:hypothetical protein
MVGLLLAIFVVGLFAIHARGRRVRALRLGYGYLSRSQDEATKTMALPLVRPTAAWSPF